MTIKLIVGLGNIGANYYNTRHNLGSKYVSLLAKKYKKKLNNNKQIQGYVTKIFLCNNNVRLLIPNSYMNNSGDSVFRCVDLYRLNPENILVVHDDLDLLPGRLRIKLGNKNYASHKGIQDIIIKLNNCPNFYRLRIGIGRPENGIKIVNFVLNQPYYNESKLIDHAIRTAIQYTERIVIKDFMSVMNQLHTF